MTLGRVTWRSAPSKDGARSLKMGEVVLDSNYPFGVQGRAWVIFRVRPSVNWTFPSA